MPVTQVFAWGILLLFLPGTMPNEIKSLLQAKQSEILNRLIELSARDREPRDAERFRHEASELVCTFRQAELALHAVDPISEEVRFLGVPQAIDAIVMILEERQAVATDKEILAALVHGGWNGWKPEDGPDSMPKKLGNVRRSITSFAEGKNRAQAIRLKKIGKLIGLPCWDDSRFHP